MDGRENYICFEAIKTGNKNDPKKRELSKQREPKHSFHHTHGKRQGFRLKGYNENNSAKKKKTNHSVFSWTQVWKVASCWHQCKVTSCELQLRFHKASSVSALNLQNATQWQPHPVNQVSKSSFIGQARFSSFSYACALCHQKLFFSSLKRPDVSSPGPAIKSCVNHYWSNFEKQKCWCVEMQRFF